MVHISYNNVLLFIFPVDLHPVSCGRNLPRLPENVRRGFVFLPLLLRSVPPHPSPHRKVSLLSLLSISSRNFGSYFNSLNNGILVPLADMLNHTRPRQTTWEYDDKEKAFVITSLLNLRQGAQVMDSYGRRDNRRLLFSYGFVEDDNLDGNFCSPDTVAIAILPRRYDTLEHAETADACVQASPEEFLLHVDADCGEFWNSIFLDVMVKVDFDQEKELTAAIPQVPVDPTLTTFGAELSRRSQWICEHSAVFASNLLNFDGDLHYDHSDARYVYLSRCHDDAGTVTVFGIISLTEERGSLTR